MYEPRLLAEVPNKVLLEPCNFLFYATTLHLREVNLFLTEDYRTRRNRRPVQRHASPSVRSFRGHRVNKSNPHDSPVAGLIGPDRTAIAA